MRARRSGTLRSICVGLLCLSSLSPSSAFHDPPEPLVFERAIDGSGWIVIEISVSDPETIIDLELELQAEGLRALARGAWVLCREQGACGWTNGGTFGSTDVYVKTPAGILVDERLGGGSAGRGNAFRLGYLAPGHHVVVVGTAFDGASLTGAFRLSATPGTTVLGVRAGSEAFMRWNSEFGGDVHATAMGRGVVLGGEQGTTSRNRTFGGFGSFAEKSLLRYRGPSRLVEVVNEDIPLYDEAPGTHRFEVDHAIGGGVYVWGVDAELPA